MVTALALFGGPFAFCPYVFAVDEVITDLFPGAAPPPAVRERKIEEEEAAPTHRDRTQINAFIDIQQGYDNNVDLDPRRHKDGFLQTTANVEITYDQTDTFKFVSGSDLFSIIYYKYNVDNILDITPYAGFDWEILPGFVSRNRVTYDYFSFPNEKEDTFSGMVLSTYLRHFVTEDFYQEAGFEYLRRWYPDQKVTMTNLEIGNADREDTRYRYKYNLGYFTKMFFIRLENGFIFNDSTEVYQDYYDYWNYRVKPAVMVFFTDKLYTDVSLVYRHFIYKDRRSTEDINDVTRSDLFIFNSTIYFDITKNMTLEFTYTYTENVSNDPFEKYSGSMISGGVYYSF